VRAHAWGATFKQVDEFRHRAGCSTSGRRKSVEPLGNLCLVGIDRPALGSDGFRRFSQSGEFHLELLEFDFPFESAVFIVLGGFSPRPIKIGL